MRFLRYIATFCLVFTMLSGYLVIIAPTNVEAVTTVYHVQDFEGSSYPTGYQGWFVPSSGTSFITSVNKFSGGQSVDMNGVSSIAYTGFPSAVLTDHRLHLSVMLNIDDYPMANSTLMHMANTVPDYYYSLLITPLGHVITFDGIRNNDTGKILPLHTWTKLEVVLSENNIYIGVNGIFTIAMNNQVTGDFWYSAPFNPQFTSSDVLHYYLDDVVWDDDTSVITSIIVPPIVPIINNGTKYISVSIILIIILLPAVLVGAYIGRYGFVLMLSIMAALYLIIDPSIIPVSLMIWVQSGIMFYRGE